MKDEFISGFYFDKPGENAPEFVKGKIGIKVEEFIKYLGEKKNDKGYVNIDLLESKEGKYYAKLNDWKPKNEMSEKRVKDMPF